jgi:SAM-dependent methyltransferase
MWSDVVDFRDFYEARLGQVARQLIRHAVRSAWPDLRGLNLVGLGYATPYLRPFLGEAASVAALMPAARGVLHWPPAGPNRVSLVDEGELPLPDYSVERVLMVHSLEYSQDLPALLNEVWRILTGEGRVLIVVPNRTGLWSRADGTPFGWGLPYSASQLSRVLRDHGFTPGRTARALFVPPTRFRTVMKSAAAWERIGQKIFPQVSGVVLLEAGKQVYAASLKRQGQKRPRRPVLVQVPKAAGRALTRVAKET